MMLNPKPELIQNRGLIPANFTCDGNAIQADNSIFKNQVIAGIAGGNAILPMNPGFELHPYKGQLTYANQSKIIIGTFPPISYLIDLINQQNPGLLFNFLLQPTAPHQAITRPQIPFFHGNVSALWSVLLNPQEKLQLITQLNLGRQAAKTFLIEWLNEQGIYYDDIINSTQRKLRNLGAPNYNIGYSFEDANLKNICIDESLIIKLLTNTKTKIVCFTNGATFTTEGLKFYLHGIQAGLVNTSKSDAFSLFLRGCQDLGLQIEMQCLPHYTWTPITLLTTAQKRTKLIFEIRITRGPACKHADLAKFQEISFTVLTPFSPAAHGRINANAVIINYRQINGVVPIIDILRDFYNKFRNILHAQLYQYNI